MENSASGILAADYSRRLASWYADRRDCDIERREQIQAERQQVAALERPIVEYSEGVDALFAAWMRLSGWHPHHGQWRKNGKITRRVIMSEGLDRIDDAKKADEFAWWLARDNFDAMCFRYRADMARQTTDVLISQMTNDPWQSECLRLKVGRLEHELAGNTPSPIVKILAERVAVCYLDSYYSDILAQSHCNMTFGDFCQRRQDRAHRRDLRAVKALAECRKVEASTITQTVERLRVVG